MRIVSVAGDAGGARAIAPVLLALRGAGHDVDARAYAAATSVLPRMGVPVTRASGADLRDADALLVATSVQPEAWELRHIEEADQQGVPSLAVVDHWVNMRLRFERPDGSLCLPRAIALVDDDARAAAIRDGLPPERLHATGHPGWDALAPSHESHALASARLRQLVGAQANERVALWASEPLSQLYDRATLGFLEDDALADVMGALEAVARARSAHVLLAVKRHPREQEARVPPSTPHVRALACPEVVEPIEAASGADVVLGMSSMLLFEAALVGRPVVSHQPGLRLPDGLPSNGRGWSRGVTDARDLPSALDEAFFNEKACEARALRVSRERPPPGATRRIIDLLLSTVTP